MRKTLLALCSTSVGIAALIGLRAQSAGVPRTALAGGSTTTAPTSGTSSPSAAPTAGSSATKSYTGAAESTPYGTVQVRAVLTKGRLTDVTVLQQTYGGRSSQIDSYALPVLKSEALKAQSARIDVVSGATYTSDGYARSLQAALDTAGR